MLPKNSSALIDELVGMLRQAVADWSRKEHQEVTDLDAFLQLLEERRAQTQPIWKGAALQERSKLRVSTVIALVEDVARWIGLDLTVDVLPPADDPRGAFLVLCRHVVTLASLICDSHSASTIPLDQKLITKVFEPYVCSLDYVQALEDSSAWPVSAMVKFLSDLAFEAAVAEGWIAGNATSSGTLFMEAQATPASSSLAAPEADVSVETTTPRSASVARDVGPETLSGLVLRNWDAPVEAASGEELTRAALNNKSQEEMARALFAEASKAVARQGLPAHLAGFITAQAIAETGWGMSIPRTATTFSWNALGIKQRARHRDGVANTTTEYVNGKGIRVQERFAVFGSFAECFDDYLYMMTTLPRYSGVLEATTIHEFATRLQEGGYATDPGYVELLTGVYNGRTWRRAMNTPFLDQVATLVAAVENTTQRSQA